MKQIVLLLLLLPVSMLAQMLDNRSGTAFTEQPFFNKQFIKKNGIAKIYGSYTYKKTGDVMRATNYAVYYEFDPFGRLVQTYETRKDDGTKDTVFHLYTYNEANLIQCHATGNRNNQVVSDYQFDAIQRPIQINTNKAYTTANGEKQQTSVQSETMAYQNFEKQEKKTIFNSYHLAYQEEISYYNEAGYLLEIVTKNTITSQVWKKKYTYNEHGYIATIDTYEPGNDQVEEKYTFSYDSLGNLVEQQYYKKGVFTTETEIIYNEKSQLITYVLVRDVATNFIRIIHFHLYSYF